MRILACVVLATVGLFLAGCDGMASDPDMTGLGGRGPDGLGGSGGDAAESLAECQLFGETLQMPTPCPEGTKRDSHRNICVIYCATSSGRVLSNCRADYMGLSDHCVSGDYCNDCH